MGRMRCRLSVPIVAPFPPDAKFFAASMRSPSTADADGPPPAPRPYSISSPTASPSMNKALNDSRTDASGCCAGIIAGCTRTATSPSCPSATASSLTT